MRLANGERREWIKPIMFSGGLGSIEDEHVKKQEAESGRKCWKPLDQNESIKDQKNLLRLPGFKSDTGFLSHQTIK